MSQVAVYAGSFDPPTNGHVWMIEQSAALFDRLIVAVAQNPEKSYSYSLKQRLGWLRTVLRKHPNVEVASIENEFLAHYARKVGAAFVIRGIRHEADYQYERGMRYVNSDLNPGLTTVFLMPPRELCEISSSFVKGMIGPEGWEEIVSRYVPAEVFADLRQEKGAIT
ncbi:MAG: pantetheine-phosphate adenylyltransferase [Phycisphaeraceae bacterium]|nr:pantetheine-phosphate adenylyltransferase [Phycisphaeraceae bacterium]MCW5762566.1 pantetheine-phosphate adenylyltransferase [Phycisphaeraceae bacterium]